VTLQARRLRSNPELNSAFAFSNIQQALSDARAQRPLFSPHCNQSKNKAQAGLKCFFDL
jgi:hypothetical protein